MKKFITTILLISGLIMPMSGYAKVSARPYISGLSQTFAVNQTVELSSYNSFLAGKNTGDYTYKWEIASSPAGYSGEKKASGVGLTNFDFMVNAPGNYIVELKLVDNGGMATIPNYFTLKALGFSESFSDLPERHWARNYFYELYYAGVMTGYNDGTLRPEARVNRAEFLTMCMRAFAWAHEENLSGLAPEDSDTYFADVEMDQWYYGYIAKAVEEEIVSGYPDDTFRPEANVSLAEALKIAMNFENIIPEARTVNIDKIADVHFEDWYAKYVSTAIDQGVIEVKNYLKPNNAITQAEAAMIICESFFGKNAKLVSWNYLAR